MHDCRFVYLHRIIVIPGCSSQLRRKIFDSRIVLINIKSTRAVFWILQWFSNRHKSSFIRKSITRDRSIRDLRHAVCRFLAKEYDNQSSKNIKNVPREILRLLLKFDKNIQAELSWNLFRLSSAHRWASWIYWMCLKCCCVDVFLHLQGK